MVSIVIQPSNKKDKKYEAVIDNKKTVAFGATGYSDFTKHKDEDRKKNYIARHKPNQDWKDHTTAGFYSRWLLWSKPTLREAVAHVNKKFPNLDVKLKV